MMNQVPLKQGLYDPWYEKDACGVGFVADIQGRKSHSILQHALTALDHLKHRGACGCEANTGDGAGILLQLPHAFLKKAAAAAGFALPQAGEYGVGMAFLPKNTAHQRICRKQVEALSQEEGLRFLGWRDVPTDNGSLGESARASEPAVSQFFVVPASASSFQDDQAFERKLFI